MDLDWTEFGWKWDENLVSLPEAPWAYPRKEVTLFLPTPYDKEDWVTRAVVELFRDLRANQFQIPQVCLEIRFQVLNGKPGHWVTDLRVTGSLFRKRTFEFALQENKGKTVVRLAKVTSPTMIATHGEKRWEIESQSGRMPRADPLESAITQFKTQWEALPRVTIPPVHPPLGRHLLDGLSPYGPHSYKIYQVVGKGGYVHSPMVHLTMTCRRDRQGWLGWHWAREEYYRKNMNVNCTFFRAQSYSRGDRWLKSIATVLLPRWECIYCYPLDNQKWPATTLRDRDPRLKRLREQGGSVNEVLVPFPLPIEGRMRLDRQGEWYPAGC